MRRFLALMLAIAMLATVGCAKKTNDPGTTPDPAKEPAKEPAKKAQVIRINIGAEPQTLDPLTSTGVPESQVQQSLYEGLMRLDKDGRAVPGMAAAMPTVSADGLTYTVKLRDAKWSNGDPVTANDFVYSWRKALDPRTASEYAYQLHYLKGGEDLNYVPLNKVDANGDEIKGADGKAVPRTDAEIAADVEKAMAALGVKAVDAKTLEITLHSPTPFFTTLMSFHTLAPVHKASVESNPEAWFRDPKTTVTNGPFKLESWTSKDRIVVVKNPNYYDAGVVKLDKIEYFMIEEDSTAATMFESGQLDIQIGIPPADLERLKAERPDEAITLSDLATYFYRFNVTKKPFDDARVRKALALAIDRAAITKNITKAGQIPAMAFVPPGIPDATGDFRANGGNYYKDNDVETAKKLLEEAGFPGGKGFPKFTIMYNTHETHKMIAEAVQEMWKKNLGIEVTLENVEWQVYLDRQTKLDYDVSRAGWLGDYVDPMTFMDMFVKDGGNNSTGWVNAAHDAAIDRAKKSGDQKVRMEAMHEAEKILMNELPIVPFYYYVRTRLIGKNVKGWYEPLTAAMTLREAYVE